MSGIKENQEINKVRQVFYSPAKQVCIQITENCSTPVVVETVSSAAVNLVAPQRIDADFRGIEKSAIGLNLSQVRKIASTAALITASKIYFSNAHSAQKVATLVGQIHTAQSNAEIQETCTRIKSICIGEQMPIFKKAITATVKTVMSEVGYTNITIKTIGITPVVIAKNSTGQTIRTEITEGINNKIDLVRIQSAIPESECDTLNHKINEAFQKYGLEYARFCKVSKTSMQQRTLNLSENECLEQNNQATHLKQ